MSTLRINESGDILDRPMTLKEARAVTGHKSGLGRPGKMPGWATAIPAEACKVGAKLALITGSVCAKCYAFRGNYLYPSVKEGHQRRLEALTNPLWTDGMIKLIGHHSPRRGRPPEQAAPAYVGSRSHSATLGMVLGALEGDPDG